MKSLSVRRISTAPHSAPAQGDPGCRISLPTLQLADERGSRLHLAQRPSALTRPVSAGLLRHAARSMLPFLSAVAYRRGYARAWSKAVVEGDLNTMTGLLQKVSPKQAGYGLGTNGIGYFFSLPEPWLSYSVGTTIPPGSVQFLFSPRVHRQLARLLIPYYRRLLARPAYAASLARAIRRGDNSSASRLARLAIPAPLLHTVKVDNGEFRLSFQDRTTRYPYDHLLFPFLD